MEVLLPLPGERTHVDPHTVVYSLADDQGRDFTGWFDERLDAERDSFERCYR